MAVNAIEPMFGRPGRQGSVDLLDMAKDAQAMANLANNRRSDS